MTVYQFDMHFKKKLLILRLRTLLLVFLMIFFYVNTLTMWMLYF